jgi:CRP/FNR family transcriptional regulator, cyclic AMP receptor protein
LPTKTRKKHGFDPARFLATGENGRSLIEYRRDEVLFSQRQPADAVFYVRKGKVKLVVTSQQGKQAVVAILGVDDFLGEGCLNGESVRLATARAVTEIEVTRVEKAEMIRILHAEPAFAEMFMAHLLHRTSRIQEDLVDQLFNSSEKRLARALLLLANFGKDDALTRITLPFTCPLPWLTSMPLASVTVTFENAASSVSVNVSVTSCGAALKAEPADGLACAREACACADGALTISKSHDKAAKNDRPGRVRSRNDMGECLEKHTRSVER